MDTIETTIDETENSFGQELAQDLIRAVATTAASLVLTYATFWAVPKIAQKIEARKAKKNQKKDSE